MDNPWTTPNTDLQVVGSKKLNEGSYGIVWKARHRVDGGYYAVKQVFIDRTLRHVRGKVDSLFAEVHLLKTINSENIVRYHTCWLEGENVTTLPQESLRAMESLGSSGINNPPVENKFLFIQMELCHSTLKHWLIDSNTMESRAEEIPQILTQLALALKTIHDQNIIHRDLKPGNIFYSIVKNKTQGDRLIWKIGDFGLARTVVHEEHSESAMSDDGTPYYQSPDGESSPKSDVYSMGIIFLETLQLTNSGDRSFRSMVYKWWQWRTISHMEVNPMEDVKNLIFETHPKECQLIGKMLNLQPTDRLTAKQVWEILTPETEGTNPKEEDASKSTPEDQPLWFEVGRTCSNFVGRAEELKRLKASFESAKIKTLVINGLGGVGKSELAKEFAKIVYNELKGSCIWLEGDTEESLNRSIAHLGQKLELPKAESLSLLQIFGEMSKKLNNPASLFIIDNVDNVNKVVEKVIQDFKKLAPNTRLPFIVITTRNWQVFTKTVGELIELPVLDDCNAIELVLTILPDVPHRDAKSLCEVLQNYPLALQQAVCFIQERRRRAGSDDFDVPKYLKLFQKRKKEVLDHGLSLENHEYSLTTLSTWGVSFESIQAHPELGSIAERLFHLIAYALDAENESVEFVISLYDKLTPTIERRGLRIDEDSSDTSSEEDEDDMGLEFDRRPVARAIQLIRIYSMCNVDKFKLGSTDNYVTVMSVHRLVQEVIRVNLGKILEKRCFLNLGQSFNQIRWQDMENIDSTFAEGELRGCVRVFKKFWIFVTERKSIVPQLKDIFVSIWEADGFLLNIDLTFMKKTYDNLLKIMGQDDLSTMIVEYYLHLFLLRNVWYLMTGISQTTEEQIKYYSPIVLNLYLRTIKNLPQNEQPNRLTWQTLDLVLMYVFFRGVKAGIPLISATKLVVDSLRRKVQKYRGLPLSNKELYKMICVLGRIFFGYVSENKVNELIEFTEEFLNFFAENPLEIIHFRYVLRYIGLFISEELNMHLESMEFFNKIGELTGIYQNYDVLDVEEVEMLKGFFDYDFNHTGLPYSVERRFYVDSLDCVEIDLKWNRLACFLQWVCDRKQFDRLVQLGQKMLVKCERKCIQGMFESAAELLPGAKYAETEVWRSKRFKESKEICQGLVKLCKFRCHWDEVEIVEKWIDNFLGRLGQEPQLFLQFFELPFSLCLKDSSIWPEIESNSWDFDQISHSICEIQEVDTLRQLGNEIIVKLVTKHDQVADPGALATVTFLSRVVIIIGNCIWAKEGYEEWKSLIQSATDQLEAKGFQGYFEYKLASVIIKKVSECFSQEQGTIMSSVPNSVLIWSYIFILRYSCRLMDTPDSHLIIEKIADRLVIERSSEELVKFMDELSKVANSILECCDKLSNSELSRSQRAYHNIERTPSGTEIPSCDFGVAARAHIYNRKWSKNSEPDLIMDEVLGPKRGKVDLRPLTKGALVRQNLWFTLYSLGFIGERLRNVGKFDDEAALFQKALRLNENLRDINDKEGIITRQVALIEYFVTWATRRPSQSIVNRVLCQVVKQKEAYQKHYRIKLKDSKILPRTIKNVNERLLDFLEFKHVVELNESLMSYFEDEEVINASKRDSGSGVHSQARINSSGHYFTVSDSVRYLREGQSVNHPWYLSFFETALKVSKRSNTKAVIDTGILEILNELIKQDIESDKKNEVGNCVGLSVFNIHEYLEIIPYILRHGPESDLFTICFSKTLNYLLQTEKYSDLFRLLFDLSNIPKVELKLEIQCLACIEVVAEYLTKAGEKNSEQLRSAIEYKQNRFGDYKAATRISDLNNMDKFVFEMNKLTRRFKFGFDNTC